MTTARETKSQFLPSISFYQAPSLAQRVDYLRSPGKLSDLTSLRSEFVVLSGEHTATSKCANVPAREASEVQHHIVEQLWPDTDDEWWEDDCGDSRSGEPLSGISLHLEELPPEECESDPLFTSEARSGEPFSGISSHLEELPPAECESDPLSTKELDDSKELPPAPSVAGGENSTSDACPDDTNEIGTADADHQHTRDPSWSAGAIRHDAGDCRPCAWNWKRSGCIKGTGCEFCHMCDEGIVKLRKKEKLVALKQARATKKETKIVARLEVPLPIGLVRKSSEEQGGGANTPSTSTEPSIASPAASEGNMVSCI